MADSDRDRDSGRWGSEVAVGCRCRALSVEGGGVKLVLSFQGVRIREYVLDRPTLSIGRHPDNDIVIDHMGVSGRHAKVTVEGESILIADLQSTNGTFVNGHRVDGANLRPNDWISIGKHILTLKADSR